MKKKEQEGISLPWASTQSFATDFGNDGQFSAASFSFMEARILGHPSASLHSVQYRYCLLALLDSDRTTL